MGIRSSLLISLEINKWLRRMKIYFLNWLFIVARSYRDCHRIFVFGNGTLLIHFTPAVTYEIFPYSWQTSTGPWISSCLQTMCNRREQPWHRAAPSMSCHIWNFPTHGRHLSGRGPQVVFRLRPTWTIMWCGNLICELLYEFTLRCHLLRNLSIRSPSFWQQWFQISRNIKLYHW